MPVNSDSEESEISIEEAVGQLREEMNNLIEMLFYDDGTQRLNKIEARLDALEYVPNDAASSASSGGKRRRRRKKRTRRK